MLTKKQKHILDYIEKFISKKDYSPSIEEIGKHFKLANSTIHEHIQGLKGKGYLNKNNYQARAIELVKDKNTRLIEIPIVGNIAAGKPIEVIEIADPETISLSQGEVPSSGKIFALRVQGDSMVEEGIFDGDIVVIREQNSADNGQTVVAIIDDNQATLKKIYREKNRFRLQPANQTLLPFYRTEVEIRGIVVKIIRQLEPADGNEN